MTCSGHCCRAFTLPSPDELEIRFETGKVEDGEYIKDMLIYIGPIEEHPIESSDPQDQFFGHVYTCKHHDSESGKCKEYASRPAMCSEYPYHSKCRYVGCTFVPPKSNWLDEALLDEALDKLKTYLLVVD